MVLGMGGDNDGAGNQDVGARIEYDDDPELENNNDVPKDGDAYNRPGMGKCDGVEMPTTGRVRGYGALVLGDVRVLPVIALDIAGGSDDDSDDAGLQDDDGRLYPIEQRVVRASSNNRHLHPQSLLVVRARLFGVQSGVENRGSGQLGACIVTDECLCWTNKISVHCVVLKSGTVQMLDAQFGAMSEVGNQVRVAWLGPHRQTTPIPTSLAAMSRDCTWTTDHDSLGDWPTTSSIHSLSPTQRRRNTNIFSVSR
jgi:hypothetical protein